MEERIELAKRAEYDEKAISAERAKKLEIANFAVDMALVG